MLLPYAGTAPDLQIEKERSHYLQYSYILIHQTTAKLAANNQYCFNYEIKLAKDFTVVVVVFFFFYAFFDEIIVLRPWNAFWRNPEVFAETLFAVLLLCLINLVKRKL